MTNASKKTEPDGELAPDPQTLRPGDILRIAQGVWIKGRPALTSRSIGRANPKTPLMILEIKTRKFTYDKRRPDSSIQRYWLKVVGNDSKTQKQIIGWYCYTKQGYRTVRIGVAPTEAEVDSAINEGVEAANEGSN